MENGGIVTSYHVTSGSLLRQFTSPGEDSIQEFVKGDGLRWDTAKIGNLNGQAVERNLVESLRTEAVWWPRDMVHQPFGEDTKYYSEMEIIHMLYDMEDYSDYS